MYIIVVPRGTKDHLVNFLPIFGGLLEISLVFINILIGFESIIPRSSSSLLFELSVSVEEEGHKGRLTIIDI